MGIREDVLALADDVESTIGGCYGCLLDKRGLCKAETDFDCNDEMCKFVAHRLRAIAEKDAENVTTVSAYDLLPGEDRKAIAWVREQGGLDFKAIRRGGSIYGHTYRYADEEERPAPKVLAADGEPLEVGQTVYAKNYGYVECTVLAIEWVVDGYLVGVENEGGHKFRQTPDEFTHQRPVLDADGEEIKQGDTVYVLGFGEPLTVKGFTDDGRVLMSFHDENSLGYKPSKLTHEQPDTWERLEHDAEKTVCEYFGANYGCANCPLESARCAEEVKKDIIRRARKLAKKESR